jgi:hypothetical protein
MKGYSRLVLPCSRREYDMHSLWAHKCDTWLKPWLSNTVLWSTTSTIGLPAIDSQMAHTPGCNSKYSQLSTTSRVKVRAKANLGAMKTEHYASSAFTHTTTTTQPCHNWTLTSTIMDLYDKYVVKLNIKEAHIITRRPVPA